MSRSRRKAPFGSYTNAGSMKWWRQMVNQRHRHNCKQLINTCQDWDSLILPVMDESGNLYDSPADGRKHFVPAPVLNSCEVEDYEFRMRWGYRATWKYKDNLFNSTGHFKNCDCYTNKRGWYWKLLRK